MIIDPHIEELNDIWVLKPRRHMRFAEEGIVARERNSFPRAGQRDMALGALIIDPVDFFHSPFSDHLRLGVAGLDPAKRMVERAEFFRQLTRGSVNLLVRLAIKLRVGIRWK